MATSADNVTSTNGLGNGRANGAGNVSHGLQREPGNEPANDMEPVAVPAASDSAGMAVAGSESAVTPWNQNWSLDRRLLAAQSDVATLDKDVDIGRGDNVLYQAISGDQVVAVGKAALVKHGILFKPDMDKESSKKDGNKTLVWIQATLTNVDDPKDTETYGAWGEGVDTSAHGHQKAYTNGVKQILSKALLLTTVGDEHTDGKEAEHVPSGDSGAAREAKAETENTLRAWADNFKTALDKCETLPDLKQVRSDNAHMLKSANLPDKTRDYFADRIAHLKDILS